MRLGLSILLFFSICPCWAQNSVSDDKEASAFISYHTGNKSDARVSPSFGITMMGGRSEHDEAMKWFLGLANGGDILVLRASGSDGYNDYLYNKLGVEVNSVESLVIKSIEAANDAYVIDKIEKAEAIWMAGGNQWNYIGIWGNSKMKNALNNHIKIKKGAIGGTSAGMAVLGQYAFSAENGSVTSAQAMSDPYGKKVRIAENFLAIDQLANTITDTHYANRNRQGRHSTFMARLTKETNSRIYGIACDEYTAVCIDDSGIAKTYGRSPEDENAVYFIQSTCQEPNSPEELVKGKPITWNRDSKAMTVYKIIPTPNGADTFDLNTWQNGSGGTWKYWYIDEGNWFEHTGKAPNCN